MQTHHPDLPALMPVRGGHHRCTQCDRIIYSDPKVAVAAIIPMGNGIVLLKRAIEPQTWQSGVFHRDTLIAVRSSNALWSGK